MNQASKPFDTRLRPFAALRALRRLRQDREDTRQVFLVMDAMRGRSSLHQLERFRRTEVGQCVLAERRELIDRLNQRSTLAQLPPGTLGREYHEFMSSENLSAQGLAEVSSFRHSAPGQELRFFQERNRDMHDLLHLVSGYGRDPLGEACVVAFSYAQTTQKGFAMIALFGAHAIARQLPGQPVRRAVFNAYLRGRRAKWLIGADWEALLAEPLQTIRQRFEVQPSRWYSDILQAVGPALTQRHQVGQSA